jgi:hypothetical protein
LGLHELEEYPCAENFSPDLGRRGVWIAAVSLNDIAADGIPTVRAKEALDVFRIKRL